MRIGIVASVGILAALVSWDGRGDAQQADNKSPNANWERVKALIDQLGSDEFKTREQATRDLEKIGAPALDLLRQAAKDGDVETKRRATVLVSKIDLKLITEKMLAPKRLRLAVKDAPVDEAVAQLAKLSGYALDITGDKKALQERKITLDTGETTFWQALEQLCAKADLHDLIPVQPEPARGAAQGGQGGGRIVINVGNLPKVGGGGQPGKPNAVQPMPAPQRADGSALKILLAEGKAPEMSIHLAGSVRVRAVLSKAVAPAGEIHFTLDASAEPRLQPFGIIGSPVLEKAIDDQGQVLLMAPAPAAPAQNPNMGGVGGNGIAMVNGQVFINGQPVRQENNLPKQRSVPLRLKLGDKAAKSLKEISGTLIVQALREPEALVTVDNILKAAGKNVKGKDEHQIDIVAVEKLADGVIKIQFIVQRPGGQNPLGNNIAFGGGNVVIGGVNMKAFGTRPLSPQEYPKLIDATGKAFAPTTVAGPKFNNNQMTYELTYAPQNVPMQLVLYGQRPQTFAVPFVLKNVPLP